ncbi:MAG: outer membrane lipoprotein-sorting protein [Proteobacteria bacterium]|nr:outer membrane lipoprotein-sorting protein [Pseudomonadota bacterium]
MKLARLLLSAIWMSCLVAAAPAMGAPPDADGILGRVRDRNDGDDVYSDLKLVLIDEKGGTRVRELLYLQRDYGRDEKLTLYFTEPSDVKGVAFQSVTYDEKLGKDDDQWIYLPAFRQIRRIASADKRGSFMGSEYAYIDMEKLRVADYRQKLVGEEVVLGQPCWVIERIPVSEEVINRTGYHKTVVWVEKAHDIVLKQTYYDAKGVQFKVMTVKKLEKIQDIWTVMESHMQDLVSRKASSLIFSNVRYNVSLADKLFRQTIMKTGVGNADLPALR